MLDFSYIFVLLIMFYSLKIKWSNMKSYIVTLLSLAFITSTQLSAQQHKAASSAESPTVVLTSINSGEKVPASDSWDHLTTLNFYNQTDQVVQYIRKDKNTTDIGPHAQLMLAHNLKKQGKYEQASQWYQAYQKYDFQKGKHFSESCQTAIALRNKLEQQRIYPLNINSGDSEFSPCISSDGLLFFRMNQSIENAEPTCRYNWMLAEGEEANFERESKVDQRFSAPENIIFMDISPSGKKVVFTKLTDQSCFNGYLTPQGMATYEADILPNGDWAEIRPLPFNTVGQRTAYATYGTSDDVLYFASDILSGFGGFDIYRAEREDNRTWTTPQNLGPKINTEGNEITPKFNGSIMSFASDYHKGLGGFDLFFCVKDKNKFLPPVNAGSPINSSMDDWNLVFVDRESGYLVSNRSDASANSDLYFFEDLEESPQPKALQVNYSKPKAEVFSSVTAFPLSWSQAQIDEYKNKPDNKDPVRVKYTVQIAVISKDNNSFNRLQKELGDLDDLYKVYFEDVVKIRVGSYEKELPATLTLQKVKSRGYTDAFIVTEKMIVASSSNKKDSKNLSSRSNSSPKANSQKVHINGDGEYMVRLATYLHPDNFDATRVSGLGEINSLEKGPYTIFLLGHYRTIEAAQKVKSKAKNQGFTNAQIIRLEGDDIIRVSVN